MDKELESYLENAKPSEEIEFLMGIEQTENHFNGLDERIKSVIPEWLKTMLIKYKIANLLIDTRDIDGEEISVQFNSFELIQDAGLEAYPGLAILELGYLGIAEDPTGSGDPYFISLKEGNNPPVYQIYHDVSDVGEEIIKEGKELISHKLSDLFKNQKKE